MKWNLRMVAAEREIWRATDLQRALGAAGLVISKGKMSKLWSRSPISVRLDDLDVLCAVLDCQPSDLLVPEAPPPPAVAPTQRKQPAVRPSRRSGRTLPPA
jgi:DNA-binding Xre family transcriptional regulator